MKQKLRFCKRIFALVLAFSMVFSVSDVNMMTAKAAEGSDIVFSDIAENPADWKYTSAVYAVETGLMTGTDVKDGVITFEPDKPVTRAQFVQILYNAAGKPAVTYSDEFTDVPEGAWFTNAVMWAKNEGITSGIGGGLFGVNDEIPRQQMARLLELYAAYCGYSTAEKADLSGYPDESSVEDWAKTAMQWANAMGIINGVGTSEGTKLQPAGTASRAQAATVMKNFADAYPVEAIDPDAINLEAKKAETNGVFEFVASDASNAVITYDKTVVNVDASTWGQQEWWSVQWSVQDIDVTAGKWIVEYDIVSTIDKPAYSKLTTFGGADDDAPIIENTHDLKAGVSQHYSETVTIDADKTVRLFFNLAGGNGEGKVTISNVKVVEAPPYIDLEAKKAETNGVFEFVAADASNAVITYDKTAVNVEGSTWGQQEWWSVQWSVQNIDVTAGDWIVEYDIVSTIDKPAYSKLTTFGGADDDAPIIENTHDLKAGVSQHYSETVTIDADKTVRLFFNLAAGTGEGKVTISNVKVVAAPPYINLEAKKAETNGVFEFVAADASNAVITYDKTAVNVEGSTWGQQDWWSVQWSVQGIDVTAGECVVEYDIVSTIDKPAYSKLTTFGGADDDAPIIEYTHDLKAGVSQHYSETVTIDADKTVRLFFNLAAGTGEGKVTISNIIIGGSTTSAPVVTEKGKEYDFSADAADDNAANDFADPGKNKEDYTLIWADEFDGNYGEANVDAETGLNLDNWAYQLGDGTTDCSNPGWGNNELECYTDDVKNIGVNEDLNGDGVKEGVLRLTGSYEETPFTYEKESAKNYTSGRIRSTQAGKELFNTTYGYVEARMALPLTQGAWPAFWMLPQNPSIYGGWPVSGELDIMETTGKNTNKACGTLHWGAPDHVYKGSGYVELDSEISYFHTYAVDWQPNSITWYFDGEPVYTSTNWESGTAEASDKTSFDAPFDQPFYILLNLAIDSGQFGGSANKANFQDDINMYVDYVRVYQKDEGYPEYATKTAGSGMAEDWADFAGQNQIAELTESNVLPPVNDANNDGGMDDRNSDSANWYLSYQTSVATKPTVSTVKDADEKVWAKVEIPAAGSQDYAVQLIGHYDAKQGYVYKVSFDTYAEGDMIGKKVNADSKEWNGWSAYGIESFDLSATPETTSFMIAQTEDFDKCRIEFNVGGVGTGTVYISNVKVEIVDPELFGSTEDPEGARKPLGDGNVIYNGTFDQGDKHIGYWSVADGTKLEVPRYTTAKIDDSDVSVVDVASKITGQVADGIKYYERRAEISATTGAPSIYQSGMKLGADTYTLTFDMYSAADTTVNAAIYSTDEEGALVAKVVDKTMNYTASEGLKNFSWAPVLEEEVTNAALVLTFGEGADVQVDNVVMIGDSLKPYIDPNPLKADGVWIGDNGAGGALALETAEGVTTLKNVTSGGNWYSPQIGSPNFALISGQVYKFTGKFKLTGESNNTLEYIIQENGGGWYVYGGGVKKLTYDPATADAEGFCSFEFQFTADKSLETVHANFGLGNSGANGAANFSFKDVVIVTQ